MKILFINTVYGTGSTGRIVAELMQIAQENSHECLAVYGRETGFKDDNAIRIGNKIDNYVHAIATRITDKHSFYSSSATKKIIRAIEQYNPDVIHLHNLHGYYINIEIFFGFLKRARIKVVWTLHDCWAFTGHCSHFEAIGCSKWKEKCYQCPIKKNYPASILLDNSEWNYINKKQLFCELDNLTLVTPSFYLKNLVEHSFLSKYPCHVIRNGIDIETFSNRKSGIKDKLMDKNKKMLLGVANIWESSKGLNDFVELAKTIKSDWQIVLIGLSSKQRKEMPRNIIGMKRIDNVQELVELYSAADVYVNASIEETMGMTTAEAMACGTPVVVYDAMAIPEIVSEACGMVVEKNNIFQVKESIVSVLADRESYSESCRRYVVNCLDKRELYRKYLETYMS